MSISKQPAVGTPLSIICKTPAGNTLVGVTLEVVGLRSDISEEVGPTVKTRGQIDYVISNKEVDDTRNSPSEKDLGLAEEECILNLRAFIPSSRLGPNTAPFQAGGADTQQIRLRKASKQFGPSTPVVLTLIHECLIKFNIDLAILRKRVRNLTVDEAYRELIHRHKQGTIRLIPEPKFDDSCVPQTPTGSLPRSKTVVEVVDGKEQRRTEPVNGPDGKRKVVATKLINMDPRVGAVRLLYNPNPTRSSTGTAIDITNVNPINAAGLVRLILLLATRLAITEFHHIGIGRNVIVNAGDCHDWGRAIDFAGVRLPDPAGKPNPLLLSLQEDWATESVPKVAQIGQRPSREDRDSAWPNATRDLEYRFLSLNLDFSATDDAKEQQRVVARALNDRRVAQILKDNFNKVNKDPKHTPEELEAVRAPLLAERKSYVLRVQGFFQFFFDWAADNYSQGSETPDAAPQTDAPLFPDLIGPPSPPANNPMGLGGRIMHPDHHDTGTSGSPPVPDRSAKNGREAHNGHYHIQIGPTHGKTPDEPAFT